MKAAAHSILLSEQQIQDRVAQMAQQISHDYRDGTLIVIGVLKGSFMFVADLVRKIDPSIPVELDFLSVASYGSSTTSSGEVRLRKDIEIAIEGKDVLVVEDIVDTGSTLTYVMPLVIGRKARSVKIATLLEKPENRSFSGELHYVGFQIPNAFVIGYGLDYGERYRNLPDIRVLDEA